jgi:N-acetylneuraminate synthase
MYEDASVPLDWTPELKRYCDEIGIDFFTTPYDLEYVDYLDQFISCYKIGSGDITWHKMLHKVASKGKPVIISSGASNIQEVVDAVKILSSYDIDICLMQCNTNYTVDAKNFKYINLNVLNTYKTMFPNIKLGLSDHTPGDVTVLGAVSLGAIMVEKHFTDDNNREGPDHPFSMNPASWKEMVDRVRLLEISLGRPVKSLEDNERETVVLQRRSIRVNKNLTAGHVLKEEDLFEVRPCPVDAIPPSIDVVGSQLTVDMEQNSYLKYEHITK